MRGKLAIAFVFWFATLTVVIKLFHTLPPHSGGGYFLHDSVAMILAGCFLLLLAMALKRFSILFSQYRSNKKNLTDAHRRDPERLISSFQAGE